MTPCPKMQHLNYEWLYADDILIYMSKYMHVNNLWPHWSAALNIYSLFLFIFVSRPVHFILDTYFRWFFSIFFYQAECFCKATPGAFPPLNKEDGESRCSELHPVSFSFLFLFFGRGDETKGPGLPQNLYFSCISTVTHLPTLRGSRRMLAFTRQTQLKGRQMWKDVECAFPAEASGMPREKGPWIHSA